MRCSSGEKVAVEAWAEMLQGPVGRSLTELNGMQWTQERRNIVTDHLALALRRTKVKKIDLRCD
jgi:hypothetical protein